MKILFLLGSNAPQKSGVADYVHALALSLLRHDVVPISLSLYEPDSSIDLSGQCSDGIIIDSLPRSMAWRNKADRLKKFIEDIEPDWISLQYVPYAFNQRGIPLGMLGCLSSVRKLSRWHVMAHELWLDPSVGVKNRSISKVQREILIHLLSSIKPNVVHTTNFWYRDQLSGIGFTADILPLFSNIPIAHPVHPCSRQKTSEWKFLLFGSINREWQPQHLLSSIEQARRFHGIGVCRFTSVGWLSDAATALWDSLSSLGYSSFQFSRLGPLLPDDVSLLMQEADFGISVTPSHLIGKSASAAAMTAHGLPITIDRLTSNCEAWHRYLKQTGCYVLMDDDFVEQMGRAAKFASRNILDDVADQFIKSLRQAA